ncbi:MAG: hypothetical protein QM523_05085 [Candidatus Pacebacteria bacterium]|nr:hypothetical protein [Candidatus Paceibacterota bacterium]
MKPHILTPALVIASSLLLIGCSPTKMTASQNPAATVTEASSNPAPASPTVTSVTADSPTSGTGLSPRLLTPTAQKILELQKDSRRLKAQFAAHETEYRRIKSVMIDSSQRYFNATGDIRAQLEVGTTPGNPMLQQQWEKARLELDRVAAVLTDLNQLTAKLGDDGALVAYLVEAIQATYRLGGAMDADHDALLALNDDVNREAVLVERLASQVAAALARQTAHLSNERNTISTLQSAVKIGELYTASLMSSGFSAAPMNGSLTAFNPNSNNAATATPAASAVATVTSSKIDNGAQKSPLYTVVFNRANPEFQQQLYTVVNDAIQKNPAAQFDLVTVVSGASNNANPANLAKAQRNGQTVLRALTDMGMPLERIRSNQITEATAEFNQVRLFVR